MEAKNTRDGRGTNRSYLEFGGTVDVQNTCSVIRIHDQKRNRRGMGCKR